jgi:hypothetical protein
MDGFHNGRNHGEIGKFPPAEFEMTHRGQKCGTGTRDIADRRVRMQTRADSAPSPRMLSGSSIVLHCEKSLMPILNTVRCPRLVHMKLTLDISGGWTYRPNGNI